VTGAIELLRAGFEAMARGEQLSVDFICGEGLRTSLRSELKRVILSDAFAGARLAMWL